MVDSNEHVIRDLLPEGVIAGRRERLLIAGAVCPRPAVVRWHQFLQRLEDIDIRIGVTEELPPEVHGVIPPEQEFPIGRVLVGRVLIEDWTEHNLHSAQHTRLR